MIVIPELLENSDIVEVNQMTNLEKKLVLLSQCFSPSDESFTYRWIFESTITSAEISENAANLISIVLDNIPVVKMRYGTKCDYSKVKSEIQNIILG